MEGKYYRNVGLPIGTWEAIDIARTSPICRDLFGRYPSDSQVISWLFKLALGRIQQLEDQDLTDQLVLRSESGAR